MNKSSKTKKGRKIDSFKKIESKKFSNLFNKINSFIYSIYKSKIIQLFIRYSYVCIIILLTSGILFILFQETVAFWQTSGYIKLIFPRIGLQTYSEVIAISTYYFFGFIGFLLYYLAFTKFHEEKTLKYMLLTSFILILFSFIGISLAFIDKISG
ncbi:MAG: hypothetical protein QXP60_06635 [Nitrososphaerota archaeon]